MKNWRPANWAITKRRNCDEKLRAVGGADCEHCPAKPQTCNVDYEAGADAMLDAIRKRGFISGETLRNVEGAIGWAGISRDSKWYPIPDEGVIDEQS